VLIPLMVCSVNRSSTCAAYLKVVVDLFLFCFCLTGLASVVVLCTTLGGIRNKYGVMTHCGMVCKAGVYHDM
jgi:hypothetical protein